MSIVTRRAVALAITVMLLGGCGGSLARQYEYEEEIYLDLDGSATVFVNASVPALVALRGLDLDTRPRARLDRAAIRAAFEAPDVTVIRVSGSRRRGRRFVHLRVEVADIRMLSRVAPFSWSTYAFDRRGDAFEFVQEVGSAAGRPVPDAGWRGDEIVAFRIHLPSRIRDHNARPGNLRRGNILLWEQTLAERRAGLPLRMEAHIDTQSILSRTLWLFGATGLVVAATFALVVWWVARGGRDRGRA